MQLVLHLNARFQPKHRFELEDALQEILQKNQAGEITGGGTSLNAQCHRYSEGISLTRSRAAGSCRYIVFGNEGKNESFRFKLSIMSKMPY